MRELISKIFVTYDESRYGKDVLLEEVIEPYLYFLSEKGILNPSKDPEEYYENLNIQGNFRGFVVSCPRGFDNRFPEFNRNCGKMEFQRLASGVFYVGEELDNEMISKDDKEILIVYDSKSLNKNAIEKRFISPLSKSLGDKKSLERSDRKVYGNLEGFYLREGQFSESDLCHFAKMKRMDLRVLSDSAVYLFKIRTLRGPQVNPDVYEDVPQRIGNFRNISDSSSGHEY